MFCTNLEADWIFILTEAGGWFGAREHLANLSNAGISFIQNHPPPPSPPPGHDLKGAKTLPPG